MTSTVQRAGIGGIALRYVDETGAVAADGTWSAAADLSWQLTGVDRAPARTEVQVDFRQEGDRTLIAGLGGGELRTPTWFGTETTVDRTGDVVVVTASSLPDGDRWARLVAAAVPRVRRILPDWAGGLAVEVPADAAGVDRALGADPGTYERVAAVTASADGTTAPGVPVRVLLNPDEMARQGPVGAGVVMRARARPTWHSVPRPRPARCRCGCWRAPPTWSRWTASTSRSRAKVSQVGTRVRREDVPDLPGPAGVRHGPGRSPGGGVRELPGWPAR